MSTPVLMPTSLQAETFAGVTYHIDGELVPVLTIELNGQQSIFFEHHIMLWKNTSIDIFLKVMKGALKRVFAGMQVFMTQASGSGNMHLAEMVLVMYFLFIWISGLLSWSHQLGLYQMCICYVISHFGIK